MAFSTPSRVCSIKRFYQDVAVVEDADGFAITLDGKQVRTPAKAVLVLRSRSLADAIADEWAAQSEDVRPRTMPLNQIAATALDRVARRRPGVIDEIAAYAGSDLLCHRAEAPPELVTRQEAEWQPLLDWAASTLGAELCVTAGVIPVTQAPAALAACGAAVAAHDDMALAALALAVGATGSLVLGLALSHGRIGPKEAWTVSQLDESFQIERWGRDEEADGRRQEIRADIEAAARFLALLRAEDTS